MKFSSFQRYLALLILLLCGVAKGNNVLSAFTPLHALSATTNLQENHKKSTKFIVSEFVEAIDNDETSDEFRPDFNFTTQTIAPFDSCFVSQLLNLTPKNHCFKIASNQKIHVLNCTFLI